MAVSTVGKIHDVGINDVGYLLEQGDTEGVPPYQRATVLLDPPRFATSETPFSQAVERYTYHQFLSGRNGAGQRFYDHPQSDPERFLSSEGVDSFTDRFCHTLWRGEASAPAVENWSGPAAVAAGMRVVEIGTNSYALTDDTDLTQLSSTGAATTVALTGIGAQVFGLAGDGSTWYVSGTSGIAYGTGTTQTGTLASGASAVWHLSYGAGRLAGWRDNGSQWTRTTLDVATGAEEASGGRLQRSQ